MPEVRLERRLRVPADSAAGALGELLQAIADQEGPWRGFALHVSLDDLHLPDVGYVAVPIDLTVAKHPNEPRRFDITFKSSNLADAFPTFKGSLSVEPADLGESTLTLRGEYDLPMQLFGRLLDMALLPGVADRSLENFIDEIAAACTARVDAREAEFARYHFYARNLR
ncbi:MAG TPA: hypothetical protein VFE35_00210 [Candidatus Cybelea sp.]|jgi:hypothetical protein|nr:hypothetical protein [Candidatus Cybelea sp.]